MPVHRPLVHEGKRYAPKAAIGLAFRHLRGSVLPPGEFSGGEAPGQANFVLRKLGFTVVKKGEGVVSEERAKGGTDWSEAEVRLIVADYFDMLEKDLLGQRYSKTQHRKTLLPQLGGRSAPSVEYKHANVSAVLTELGLPYLGGYKPRGNYQELLAREVEAFLDADPGFLDRLAEAPAVNPQKSPASDAIDLDQVIEEPPEKVVVPREPGKPWLSRRGRRVDFARRDAENRTLGRLGERFVVQVEKHRLLLAGRGDLAQKVELVAETLGDGLGFDVLSFHDVDGSERLVEVKTTALGKHFPFYLTDTEVRCSQDVPGQFQLFRVFDFGRAPRVYVLSGSLRDRCRLEPALYRAFV